ncbi:MAG: hypothetical protein IT385_14420 [Deltaproteobacteria bacterium]|nr:hypothetical protein [Deltaproteobacteria bacterium]
MRDAPDRIDWLVFGDDWGRHASTTQHLVAHLPADDHVIWVDSLGMRAPRLDARDLVRVASRLAPTPLPRSEASGRAPDRRARPRLLPWHLSRAAVALNRALLARTLADARARVALVANPVAALYLDALAPTRVVYLRLDRYDTLPGVDAALVGTVEPLMLARADVVIAPSARLLEDVAPGKAALLPQGVDLDRFATVPADPPATRVCGYWGWLGEWLDRDLVGEVARAHPDWTFELRGPLRVDPGRLRLGPNVVVLPPVPHAALAAHAAHWRAAWAPLAAAHHMPHASPLKLREYLAAGLPAASTPLPEARDLPLVIVRDATDVAAFLADALTDTPARRLARRAAVADASWAARAAELRRLAR